LRWDDSGFQIVAACVVLNSDLSFLLSENIGASKIKIFVFGHIYTFLFFGVFLKRVEPLRSVILCGFYAACAWMRWLEGWALRGLTLRHAFVRYNLSALTLPDDSRLSLPVPRARTRYATAGLTPSLYTAPQFPRSI
jgi:hypothetical protein